MKWALPEYGPTPVCAKLTRVKGYATTVAGCKAGGKAGSVQQAWWIQAAAAIRCLCTGAGKTPRWTALGEYPTRCYARCSHLSDVLSEGAYNTSSPRSGPRKYALSVVADYVTMLDVARSAQR